MFASCIRQKVHPAIWAVVCIKKDLVGTTAYPRGTAFAVDTHGHLLTCWHVSYVDDACTVEPDSIEVLQPELDLKRVLQAKVILRDKCRDLAVLEVQEPTKPVQLNGSQQRVPWGTSCCAFGHPLAVAEQAGLRIFTRASAGVVSMPYANPRWNGCTPIRLYEVDFFAHGGLSGGPLFDGSGHVFGVISGSLPADSSHGGKTARSNLSIAIDIVEAIQLLHANGIHPQLAGHVGSAGVPVKGKHGRSLKRGRRNR